jgi:hypothetical protein
MFDCFKKQNVNYVEILFSDFYYVPEEYQAYWEELRSIAEDITKAYPSQLLKTMSGMSMEKLKALKHPYPSLLDKIEKYGYDPKQLHHLCRMDDFIAGYWMGESFADCLKPADPEYLLDIKRGKYSLEEARRIAARTMHDMDTWLEMANTLEDKEDKDVVDLLNDVQYNIVKIGIQNEVEQY